MLINRRRLMAHIEIPYTNHQGIAVDLPDDYPTTICHPLPRVPKSSATEVIMAALDNPIQCPRLEDMARSNDKVLILVDDITRLTPAHLVVPEVIRRLNTAGVQDMQIEILFAVGSHRPMTNSEMQYKVGESVLQRVTCTNHDAYNQKQLSYYGKSTDDIDVWLNCKVAQSSLIIGIGTIEAHAIVGFSGGAKILCPGVAGHTTIAGFHIVFSMDPTNYYGAFPSPPRAAIDSFARMAGLHFVVNTVMSPDKRVLGALAGDPAYVVMHGAELAKCACGVGVHQLCDVVIVSSYPHFIDFWQGCKGIFAGATLAKPGGDIILVTACPEGCAPTHPEYASYIGSKPTTILDDLQRGAVHDLIAAAGALKLAWLRERYRVSIVSDGLTIHDCALMGFDKYNSVEDALDAVLARRGSCNSIGVIPYGGYTYCYPAAPREH
jgi:nickel-dependent lactate racemase